MVYGAFACNFYILCICSYHTLARDRRDSSKKDRFRRLYTLTDDYHPLLELSSSSEILY